MPAPTCCGEPMDLWFWSGYVLALDAYEEHTYWGCRRCGCVRCGCGRPHPVPLKEAS
ncbi:MAG TPA: hypothetical protein VNO79_05950 [Actinomycetota bacterium]|nr:hypothetical protein [Actinomycetota bacterium]